MKKLPIGIQHFRGIREDGYCYAYKTRLIGVEFSREDWNISGFDWEQVER